MNAPRQTQRRVVISVFGLVILIFIWRWSIGHLYSLPSPEAIAAFTSITQSTLYTVSVIVVFLVTGLTFFSWTQSSNIQTTVQSLVEHLKGHPDDDDGKDPKDVDDGSVQ